MLISKTISHYKILKKLGAGGMGEVYLAEDTELDRKVALKFLPPQYTEDPEINARFKREAKAAAALNHPNIITIHEIGEHEGKAFIAMEYVEGQSLKDIVGAHRDAPLSMDKILDITSQICEGLNEAHLAGIVHRDIKADNILIDTKGRVKIADFGLAKTQGRTKLTEEGSTMGTLSYMSPEQIQSANVDQRSDIFSVGVTLYEMITGQLPFKGDYEAAVSYAIMHEEPEPLARYKAGISDELQRIVDKTLSKDKTTRYQSAADLLADLNGLQKHPTSAPVVGPGKKTISKQRLVLVGFGLLLAMAIYAIFSLSNLNFFQTQKPAAITTDASQWQNSIAVLPFKNISPDPEQEYFCDGMTEQIITNLSQLQALKVIARTSVMKFKNTEKTIPEIAAELNVAHILEGSIRKVGNRIRVTAQLIQADGGFHLWAKDYDRDLDDIFAVQDDVSEAIARALLEKLTVKEAEKIKTKDTENAEAYEYYLKGEYFHRRKFGATHSMEYFEKSVKMFEEAIKLDANYALAYAGLADLYNSYTNIIKDDKKYVDLQQNYIDKAFGLDPNSARVNLVKSWVHQQKGELDKAYESRKRALEIDPNESENLQAMGSFLASHGLHHQAIVFYRKAINLDPVSAGNYAWLATSQLRVGNFHQAITNYEKTLEIHSDLVLTRNLLAGLLIMVKKYEEAEKHLARCETINPDVRLNKITRALLYAVKGRKEEAFESLKDGERNNRYHKIVIYSLLGFKDEATNLIDNRPMAAGFNVDGSDYLDMLHNSFFDMLRDTKEFKVALQKAKEIYEENLLKYAEVFL